MRGLVVRYRLSKEAAELLERMTQGMMELAAASGDPLLMHLKHPFFEQLALAALEQVATPCPACSGDGRVKFVPDFGSDEDPCRVGTLSLCQTCAGCGIDPLWVPAARPSAQPWLEHVKTI